MNQKYKINKNMKIFIAGAGGMVGSAIFRELSNNKYDNLLFPSRKELDLLHKSDVINYLIMNKPDIIILSAAKVGGIFSNMSYPGEFIFENMEIQNHLIHCSHLIGVRKFIFIGSSCIYPKNCPQPIKEEYLLSGKLEETNEAYAIAKISGIKMVQSYRKQYDFPGISIMPCNLYGTNDSFDSQNSHVLSALVKKFVDAVDNSKDSITLWGTGSAKREFMHVDDAAKAIIFLMENYSDSEMINIGWGEDISVKNLAILISKLTDFSGEILWDHSIPDGTLRKCLDVTKMIELGFFPSIGLKKGVQQTIIEYRKLKVNSD